MAQRIALLILPILLWGVANTGWAVGSEARTVTIYTDVWLPYINEPDSPRSQDAILIESLAHQAGYQVRWRYLPYSYAYEFVKSAKAELSFPYFRTAKRSSEVAFSAPIFRVNSQLYFNRQRFSGNDFSDDLAAFKIGKVAGYSYGEALDKLLSGADEFNSEKAAIQSLLDGDIDLLPMAEEVARATMDRHFPNRIQLIRPIETKQRYEPASLHLIAPKTDAGRKLLADFNAAMDELTQHGVFKVTTRQVNQPKQPDFGELVAAEGYPAIVGQTQPGIEGSAFYTIPDGTQILVLEWSATILAPSLNDRIYKTMVDLSKVLILNGPHVGKELYVKNMHIKMI